MELLGTDVQIMWKIKEKGKDSEKNEMCNQAIMQDSYQRGKPCVSPDQPTYRRYWDRRYI